MCRNTETGGGWIDDDTGMPIESMNGVVRYFHVEKGDLDKCYWGASKHEVYMKAKDRIDRLMSKEEDMSYADIAGVLNITESKVKSDLFRIRQYLKQAFEKVNSYGLRNDK